MSGLIEAIYIAPQSGQPMQLVPRADLIAGCGIRGDRNFKDTPATIGHPEQITLISAEDIEQFRRLTGLRIAPGDPRRNIVTRGIELNDWVGREFNLGGAVLSGVELCEPCATLGRRLSTNEVSPAAVVAAFTHRAGLRARIVSGGTVQPGDPVGV